ncbi:MAG TPA: benenodin family lasso peptide [Rhodanobacter sp.]
MNTNENILNDTPEEVIELGVASVDTKGGVFEPGEAMGLTIGAGISEE